MTQPATDTQLECARTIAPLFPLVGLLVARVDEKQRDLTAMTDRVIELEDMLAALEKASQLTQDGGWQDISEAPTDDESQFLGVEDGWYTVFYKGWENNDGSPVWYNGDVTVTPTHFRHIAPPASAGGA